jgi:glycine cleavage system H protein
MKFPEAVKYTKEHEWVRMDENVCVIGITDYAQSELGDIIYLDINQDAGSDVSRGDTIGSIEAVKTVSEIYSPVSGKIAEVNVSINDNPAIVNTDPYGEGWIIKIEPSNPDEVSGLMDAAAYKEHVGET